MTELVEKIAIAQVRLLYEPGILLSDAELKAKANARYWKSHALAAIRAIEGAGYKVVGREATLYMKLAIEGGIIANDDTDTIWQAAFAAAPTVGGGE